MTSATWLDIGGQPITPGDLYVPNYVRTERDEDGDTCLLWFFGVTQGAPQHGFVKPSREMLRQFLALRNVTNPEPFAMFARTWGTLRIGPAVRMVYLEASEAELAAAGVTLTRSTPANPGPGGADVVAGVESLDEWRALAKKLWAAIQVADAIKEKRDIPEVARREFVKPGEPAPYPMSPTDEVKAAVARELSVLLTVEQTTLAAEWDAGSPVIVVVNRNLVGALAVETLYALASAREGTLCSNCGEWFATKRQANTTLRAYCKRTPECKSAASRDAKRDSRLRKKLGPDRVPYKRTPTTKQQERVNGAA